MYAILCNSKTDNRRFGIFGANSNKEYLQGIVDSMNAQGNASDTIFYVEKINNGVNAYEIGLQYADKLF